MTILKFTALSGVALGLLASGAQAAVLSPALVTGPPADLINSNGGTLVETAGSTSEAAIEALAEVVSIHDFAGSERFRLTGTSTVPTTTNTYTNAVVGLPNVKVSAISIAGGLNFSAGQETTNSTFASSGSSSVNLAAGGADRTYKITLDFVGDDAGAAAFTIRTTASGWGGLGAMSAVFFDSSDSILSTQTVVASGLQTSAKDIAYFGFDSGITGISKIELTIDTDTVAAIFGLDDITYTPAVIPEPSSWMLLLIGTSLCLSGRFGHATTK